MQDVQIAYQKLEMELKHDQGEVNRLDKIEELNRILKVLAEKMGKTGPVSTPGSRANSPDMI